VVTVYNLGGQADQRVFKITGQSICRLKDCLMCWDAIDNFNCLPSTHQASLIIGLIIAIILICFLCPAVVMCFWIFCKILWKVLCLCCRCWKKTAKKTMNNNIFKKINRRIDEFSIEMVEGETPKTALIESELGTTENEDEEVPSTMGKKLKKDQETTKSNIKPKKPLFALTDPELLAEKKRINEKDIEELTTDEIDILYLIKSRKEKKTWTLQSHWVVSALIMMTLIGQSYSCSGSVIGTTELNNCLNNGVSLDCIATFTVTMTLNNIGETQCITLVDGANNTVAVGNFTFLTVYTEITNNFKYFTSSFIVGQQSVHLCNDQGSCNDGECTGCCSDRTADGNLNSPSVISVPGQSICHSSCGCVTCAGCFLCDNSCLYSGYGINAIPPAWEVWSVGQVTSTPVISYSIQSGSILYQGTVGGQSQEFTISNSTIIIDGILFFDTTVFGDNDLLASSNQVRFGPTSQTNGPKAISPGDIQSQSQSQLFSATQNAFIYDPAIITKTLGDYGDSYFSTTPGATVIANLYPTFPMILNGNLWFSTGDKLISNLTHAGAMLLTWSTTSSGLKVQSITDIVCPVVTFINATGCSSCAVGVQMLFSAKSTCASGYVTCSSTGIQILNPSVYLTNTLTTISVNILTNLVQNNPIVVFTGIGGSVSVQTNFIAPMLQTVTNNSFTEASGTDTGPNGNGFNNWIDGIFSGVFNWWQEGLSILSLVVALLIGFCLFWYFGKCFFKCAKNIKKPKTKYVEVKSETPDKPETPQ